MSERFHSIKWKVEHYMWEVYVTYLFNIIPYTM